MNQEELEQNYIAISKKINELSNNEQSAIGEEKIKIEKELYALGKSLLKTVFYQFISLEDIYNNFPITIYEFEELPLLLSLHTEIPNRHTITEIRISHGPLCNWVKLYCGKCRKIVKRHIKTGWTLKSIPVPVEEVERLNLSVEPFFDEEMQ